MVLWILAHSKKYVLAKLKGSATIRSFFSWETTMKTSATAPAAISDAYTQYAAALSKHCRYRMRDEQDADEVVQDTFINAYEYLSRGKKIDNVKVFLYSIANNLIVDWARRNKSRKQKELSLDALSENGFDIGGDGNSTCTAPHGGPQDPCCTQAR